MGVSCDNAQENSGEFWNLCLSSQLSFFVACWFYHRDTQGRPLSLAQTLSGNSEMGNKRTWHEFLTRH